MKSSFITRISAAIILLAVVSSATLSFFAFPKKAEAIAVVDAGNIAQNVIQAINTTVSAFTDYSLEYKAFVLDTLATMAAKQLIRALTASVVDWINGGFEGSPSFLTNPGGFFLDVADQFTGEWLSRFGGPLTDLCSAFSIDIRLALSFKFHQRPRVRYACTLGTIINNTRNARINVGATIETNNGTVSLGTTGSIDGGVDSFMSGNFNNGGWPAFVALTTQPQNNVYGSFLKANSELSLQVASARANKQAEISSGSGFLSWRNPACKREVEAHNARARQYYENLENGTGDATPVPQGYDEAVRNEGGGDVSQLRIRSVSDCPIETPGSLISSSLSNSIQGPLRELELVDSINEIVNALASQLVTMALQGGLKALSGSSSSDSTAYIRQVQAEAYGQGLDSMREGILTRADNFIDTTLRLRNIREDAYNIASGAVTHYQRVLACYEERSAPASYSSQVQTIIANEVGPLASSTYAQARSTDARYNSLLSIRTRAQTASSTNQLVAIGGELSRLLQGQTLASQRDIQLAEADREGVRARVDVWREDAQDRLQQCQIMFPNPIR